MHNEVTPEVRAALVERSMSGLNGAIEQWILSYERQISSIAQGTANNTRHGARFHLDKIQGSGRRMGELSIRIDELRAVQRAINQIVDGTGTLD